MIAVPPGTDRRAAQSPLGSASLTLSANCGRGTGSGAVGGMWSVNQREAACGQPRNAEAMAKISITIMLARSTQNSAALMARRRMRARCKNILICRVTVGSGVSFSSRMSTSLRRRSVTMLKRLVWDSSTNPTPEISATGEMDACKTRVKPSRFSMCMGITLHISRAR